MDEAIFYFLCQSGAIMKLKDLFNTEYFGCRRGTDYLKKLYKHNAISNCNSELFLYCRSMINLSRHNLVY